MRTADNRIYKTDDPESKSGHFLADATIYWAPSVILIFSGIAFWFLFNLLEKRLRAEIEQELASAQDAATNREAAEFVGALKDTDVAVAAGKLTEAANKTKPKRSGK